MVIFHSYVSLLEGKWLLYLGLVHLFTGSPKKGDWEPSTSDSLDDPNGDHPHGEFLFGEVSVGPGSIYNIGMGQDLECHVG